MDLIRVPVTNPGAISNSGSIQFTAQVPTIAKINYNRIVNDNEYNAYINSVWYLLNVKSSGSSTSSSSSSCSSSSSSSCGCKSKKTKKSKKSKKTKSSKY